MCGIAGWVDWDRNLALEQTTLQAMIDTLACRGPDATGSWITERAALLHQRLCVVDPAGGSQPMLAHRADATYVIVYNGELYNTSELRDMLTHEGCTFETHSDTEVLLRAYVEWGSSCVERFNGIFAFAIWNEKDHTLFMARDRLGVKPFFFAKRENAFLFASEIKSLLKNPLIKPEVDAEGLAEIFAIGPARTPGHGVFRNVHELKPGHCLLLDRSGLREHAYWQLESRPHEEDLDSTVLHIRELFEDVVSRQLVADVPVCTLLSGGLDSSAITAVAARAFAREGRDPLRTFSVDYVDNDIHFKQNAFQPDADAPWVNRVSEHVGSVHQRFEFDTPELVDSLITAMRARDLPGMADIDASLYLFCREIKKQATVALSGECADEVFGGYPWFHRPEAVNARTFPWSLRLSERLRFMSDALRETIAPEMYVARRYEEALDEVPRLDGETGHDARVRELFYLNLTRWMPTLLDRKDRMSMAVGLEVRVPFCDHRLVEYMWNVPWSIKSCDGQAKGVLRRAMRGYLPDDVLSRKKSPYPKTHNPSYLAACRSWLSEVLDTPGAPIHDLVDQRALAALMEQSERTDLPWFGQLMNVPALFAYLAQVNTWMTEYKVTLV